MHSNNGARINITMSIISKWSGVIVPANRTGRARTIQILKMLLPTMLPTRRSHSSFLAAVMVVTSSGKDVPSAMMVSEIMRSEMPIALAINEAELTTNWLPPTTPTRPTTTKTNDLPSLYFGGSISLVPCDARRLRRAMAMR